MTERPVGVTDVALGAGVAGYRTRERAVGGNTVDEQYLLYVDERVASWKGMAATFRIPGSGAANQNFAAMFNKTGSGVLVAVRDLVVDLDHFSNTASLRTFNLSQITTAPATGTLHTPVDLDTAQGHSASVEFRGGASADGTASAITATAGASAWRQGHIRNVTAVEQVRDVEASIVPLLSDKDPAWLREGEGLLVAITDATSSSTNTIVKCMWEEFTLP